MILCSLKFHRQIFIFSANGLNSQETTATLYLGKDSIFHTNLGFSFNSKSRQVNLFRTNNPVSPSPYYNTYHNVDMYFENLYLGYEKFQGNNFKGKRSSNGSGII